MKGDFFQKLEGFGEVGVLEILYTLIEVMVIQSQTFVKRQPIHDECYLLCENYTSIKLTKRIIKVKSKITLILWERKETGWAVV